eukprot:gene14873-16419_t
MGNTSSETRGSQRKKEPAFKSPYENQLEDLFEKLSQNDMFIKKENFERHFEGPTEGLGHRLFGRLFPSESQQSHHSNQHHKFTKQNNMSDFIRHAHDVLEQAYKVKDSQIRFYLELVVGQDANSTMEDVRNLLREACLYALALVDPEQTFKVDEDDAVIESLAKSCVVGHTMVCKNKFCEWALDFNPKVFSGLEAWLHEKFTGTVQKGYFHMLPMPSTSISEHSFSILTPSLLWYLCCVLPICYTRLDKSHTSNSDTDNAKADDENEPMYTWNLLYDSNEHGLSLNRFKHKCLNYKSPTVTLINFTNGTLLVLAIDEAWRDSSERFGGPYCAFLEILPNCSSILESSKIVYLKEMARSAPTGLLIGQSFPPKLKVNSDLSSAEFVYKDSKTEDILKIEIWGCGGVLAATAQKKQQDWDKKEVEKIRKVKRPGRWDENPDKEILNMAGVQTSHSQRGDL